MFNALKLLARRYLELHDVMVSLGVMFNSIIDVLAPKLDSGIGAGGETAARRLITAGDTPSRSQQHWLNRGGDRATNNALHIIATGRRCLDNPIQS